MLTLSNLLGLTTPPVNGLAWHDLIQQGLPVSSFETLAGHLKMAPADLKDVLKLSVVDTSDTLSAGESDQLFRVALGFRGYLVVSKGNVGKAVDWLKTANPLMRGRIPLHLLATHTGTGFVLTAIDKLKPTPKELAGSNGKEENEDHSEEM